MWLAVDRRRVPAQKHRLARAKRRRRGLGRPKPTPEGQRAAPETGPLGLGPLGLPSAAGYQKLRSFPAKASALLLTRIWEPKGSPEPIGPARSRRVGRRLPPSSGGR